MGAMKTLHWHKYLKPEELQNIYDTIEYCRKHQSFMTNTLYFAQHDCPMAYEEWNKSNKNNGFEYHFNKLLPTIIGYDGYQLTPYEMFRAREYQLNEILLEKQRS